MNPTQIRQFFCAVAALLLLPVLTSCEKDPEHPPLNEPGEVLSMSELRGLYDGRPLSFIEPMSVYATVTMDGSSGNIYREAYVQDATAGIHLRMDFAGDLRVGDSVRLSLKGSVLNSYNNMLQLDSVQFGNNLILQGEGIPVDPVVVEIADILAGGYQARLVRLEEVQFSSTELGRTFADAENQQSGNRVLEDCHGDRIIVRTSGFADFAGQEVPRGNGRLVAVVSQFHDNWQLLIRNPDELDMEDERCIIHENLVTSINEDFQGYENFENIEQNGWQTISEEGGRVWICRTFAGNHYAQATAFNSPDPNNIMWLITPPVDLNASSSPVLEFQSAHEFLTHDAVGLYISSDFEGDPARASWEPLEARLAGQQDSFHTWIDSGEIDLSGFQGVVHIAWRYEGSHPQGTNGSFRIDNVRLYDKDN